MLQRRFAGEFTPTIPPIAEQVNIITDLVNNPIAENTFTKAIPRIAVTKKMITPQIIPVISPFLRLRLDTVKPAA